MKYQVRKGCFETNSSSCHSLIVTKKNSNVRMTQQEIREEFYLNEDWYKDRHKNDEKETVEIDPWDNEFGRSPFDVLVTFRDKLAYAVAEYCGNNYSIKSYLEADKTFEDVLDAVKNKGLKVTAPNKGDSFEIGKAKCEVMTDSILNKDNLNLSSIVIRLEFRNNSFLFMGDA